ncbi:MAG: PQQ-binding-like beta-propeller repeat protein [bacterium]
MRGVWGSVVGVGCVVMCAGAGDWTQWRGSSRDLIVAGEKLLASWPEGGPKQAWQIELTGEGYSEPVVVGGTVYITGNTGEKQNREGILFALEAKTGKIVWQTKYGPEWAASFEFARTSPTVVDGRIYLISGLGRVVAINAKDGKEVWAVDSHAKFGGRNITWGIAENPLIYDGKVICQPGGPDAAVVALDAKTGDKVWQSTGLGERSAYCSPALLTINGKRQVVTMLEDHVVGVDAEKGTPLWQHPHRNKHAVHPNTPVLCGKDRLFISSGYGYGAEILEISGGTAKLAWSDKGWDNHFQGVSFYKGRIFSSGGGKLACFDPEKGKEVYAVPGAKKTSFCITPVGLITYDDDGGTVMLVKADADACSVVSSFKIEYGNGPHWSSPVVADGVLYLRRGKGLAAYEIGAK